jgi:hypothetical protein
MNCAFLPQFAQIPIKAGVFPVLQIDAFADERRSPHSTGSKMANVQRRKAAFRQLSA